LITGVAAPVLALSLSFDHRQIDGATGQNAMNHIKRLLNNPEYLFQLENLQLPCFTPPLIIILDYLINV
jgi:hypothetical protein